MSEVRCFLLASFALQADYGNYNPKLHKNRYFDPIHYFPLWVRVLKIFFFGFCSQIII